MLMCSIKHFSTFYCLHYTEGRITMSKAKKMKDFEKVQHLQNLVLKFAEQNWVEGFLSACELYKNGDDIKKVKQEYKEKQQKVIEMKAELLEEIESAFS